MIAARICPRTTSASSPAPTSSTNATAGGALRAAGRRLGGVVAAVYRAVAVAALAALVIGVGWIPRRGRRPRHALRGGRGSR
jgi:hypothetical protein